MTDSEQSTIPESVSAWTREVFDKAVRDLIANKLIDVEVIEARPYWAAEDRIVIGQVREANTSAAFRWVICGNVPTDHVDPAVAAAPRDVARYFSMKWQLDAERVQDSAAAERLVKSAEMLFELVEQEDIWQ
jgi:hypothetical protein